MIVQNLSTIMEVNVFERIKRIAESKKIPIKRLIEAIGMTEQGYYRMVRLNSIKNTTLTKILSFLNVNESEFYSEDFSNNVSLVSNKPIEKQTDNLNNTQIALIEKDLKMMENIIKSIRETIEH
jgi:transcriptional regulator with XRE-family HTH domain